VYPFVGDQADERVLGSELLVICERIRLVATFEPIRVHEVQHECIACSFVPRNLADCLDVSVAEQVLLEIQICAEAMHRRVGDVVLSQLIPVASVHQVLAFVLPDPWGLRCGLTGHTEVARQFYTTRSSDVRRRGARTHSE